MKGLLVRVGIDATCGFWNAPVDPATRRFVFVPIPESTVPLRQQHIRTYDEWREPLQEYSQSLPPHLSGLPVHLDPDFEHLTYGDTHPRSLPLAPLEPYDFIAFYAGLRSIDPSDPSLVYALIGFYRVREVVRAGEIPEDRWHENAHTRRSIDEDDVIIRARSGSSGRLQEGIPIGHYRDRAYRVRPDLLEIWGGLSVRDGYIQRSGRLPGFLEPERFLDWFDRQQPRLLANNY